MKIKSDFVTNSSSTSFIVNGLGLKGTAIEMLKIVSEYHINENEPEVANEVGNDIRFIDSFDKHDEIDGIYFPTTNYDTWIFKDWVQEATKSVSVNTCNNYNWSSLNRRDVNQCIDIDSPDFIDKTILDVENKRLTTRRNILIEMEVKYGMTEEDAIKTIDKMYGSKEENG